MDNGFVGEIVQIPDNYRCYILFLPNESFLDGVAETFIMRNFWEAAASMGQDVLFTGVVRGEGLFKARQEFGLEPATEPFIVLLDVAPEKWKAEVDPVTTIPLGKLRSEYEVLELLHLLVTVSRKHNFIGKMQRKKTFETVKKFLSYLPSIGDLITQIIPST